MEDPAWHEADDVRGGAPFHRFIDHEPERLHLGIAQARVAARNALLNDHVDRQIVELRHEAAKQLVDQTVDGMSRHRAPHSAEFILDFT